MTQSSDSQGQRRSDAAVAAWLAIMAALVFAMIIVGGLTRLTDSGLSITEWRLVTGAVPPLSADAWAEEFARYRTIPEYELQNRGMTLAEFKAIYWWEWGHRFLGRFLGVAFLVPFLVFLWRGWIRAHLGPRLAGLFVLGGLQGAVGWWMVASGLVDRVDVSQYRLAAHLGLAFALFAALVWTAMDAGAGPRRQGRWNGLSLAAAGFGALVFVQIIAGAFVAGLDAGRIYTDWPLMGGRLIPADYAMLEPFWLNAFENRATVQFHHRMIGYGVALGGLVVAVAARCSQGRALGLSIGVGVVAQAGLGVWTLVAAAPIALSVAHQAGAAVLFGLSVLLIRRARLLPEDRSPAPRARHQASDPQVPPQGPRAPDPGSTP